MLVEIISQSKISRPCKECQKMFVSWRCQGRKYCGEECKHKGWSKLKLHKQRTKETFEKIKETLTGRKRPEVTGSKNPLWKGGISRVYKTGYYSHEYRDWRRRVFIRDKYICQSCKITGVYVTAHHIKSFAYYPELRFELSNGVTLCEECHKKTDNYKGKNRNK